MPGTTGEQLINFYLTLQKPTLPAEVEVLFPFDDQQVQVLIKKFFNKFYNDNDPRRLILGINPGRFGAGATGINFTATRQLKQYCAIDHDLKDQSELSAEFIYEMITAFGGPSKFYRNYFIGAVSPLGFIRGGVNMNYYDDKKLAKAVTPFIIENIRKLIAMGFNTDKCYCIGGDKNLKFLTKLNATEKFFEKIIPLPHPRFIMQYRRKKKDAYIQDYLDQLAIGGSQ